MDLSHRILNVLRIKNNETISIFNNKGQECLSRVSIEEKQVVLNLSKEIKSEINISKKISLCVSIINMKLMDLIIQKSVELGVTSFIPIYTQRSQYKNVDKKLDHWEKTVIHATEQCGRLDIMKLSHPVSLSDFDNIYNAFYDEYEKLNAFLHSHSYTANPIACSAANATLDIFKDKDVIKKNKLLSAHMTKCFESLKDHPNVSDVRQKGMVLAIELIKDKKRKVSYDWKERRGIRAYLHGLKNNVLMRPLGNVLYFMPPYVITKKEISFVSEIMKEGVDEATKKKFIEFT